MARGEVADDSGDRHPARSRSRRGSERHPWLQRGLALVSLWAQTPAAIRPGTPKATSAAETAKVAASRIQRTSLAPKPATSEPPVAGRSQARGTLDAVESRVRALQARAAQLCELLEAGERRALAPGPSRAAPRAARMSSCQNSMPIVTWMKGMTATVSPLRMSERSSGPLEADTVDDDSAEQRAYDDSNELDGCDQARTTSAPVV